MRNQIKEEAKVTNIRLAELSDQHSIDRLSQHLGYPSLDHSATKSNLEALIKSPTDQIWLYQKDQAILGWIHVFIAYRVASKPFIEIGGIVTDPQHRRIGVGQQLVNRATQWAAEKNMPLRVRCNSTREDTHQFYRSINFQTIKQQVIFEQT